MGKFAKIKEKKISVAVFLVTMLVACSPLISKYCINGHDLEYHLLRIESLKEGILMCKPFLKVNTLFFNNAGYASSMFYPDFLLYIPALLRMIGVSINASYHIFVAIIIILGYFFTFYSVKLITKSETGALVSAIILTLCQYHLDDIYVRSAVGEYCAFVFVPLVICGIYNAIYEDFSKPWLLGAGYVFVLLCHTGTFVMCLVFGLFAFIIKGANIIKFGEKRRKLLLTILIAVLITSFYWCPMLEQMLNTTFYVSNPWANPMDEAVDFFELFRGSFPSMGYLLVVFCLPRLFIGKSREDDNITFADWLLIGGFLFVLLSTNIFPWEIIGKYLSFIQFPWRFYLISSCLLAMAIGILADAILLRIDKGSSIVVKNSIVCSVLAVAVVFAIMTINAGQQGYYDYSDDYYDYEPYTANVIAGEWLPMAVTNKETLVDDAKSCFDNMGRDTNFVRVKNTVELDVTNDLEYVDVPLIYYKGYKAWFFDSAGRRSSLSVTNQGRNGFCRVFLPKDDGRIKVEYSGTPCQMLSTLISLVTITGLVVVCVRNKRKKSLKNEKIKE